MTTLKYLFCVRKLTWLVQASAELPVSLFWPVCDHRTCRPLRRLSCKMPSIKHCSLTVMHSAILVPLCGVQHCHFHRVILLQPHRPCLSSRWLVWKVLWQTTVDVTGSARFRDPDQDEIKLVLLPQLQFKLCTHVKTCSVLYQTNNKFSGNRDTVRKTIVKSLILDFPFFESEYKKLHRCCCWLDCFWLEYQIVGKTELYCCCCSILMLRYLDGRFEVCGAGDSRMFFNDLIFYGVFE